MSTAMYGSMVMTNFVIIGIFILAMAIVLWNAGLTGSFRRYGEMGVLHADVTYVTYLIGFIPGIVATVIETSIAGIGIYKRETDQLFKELEA